MKEVQQQLMTIPAQADTSEKYTVLKNFMKIEE